jgi:uncharacterized protein with GYD domain
MILSDGGKRRKGGTYTMPKYLLLFKYSPEGAKGFLKEKATPRETEIRKTFEGMGGKVEELYWTTGGEYTGAIVMELPSAATGAAFSMVAEATGAFVEVATMEVLTSSELDRALAKTIAYRPPGG